MTDLAPLFDLVRMIPAGRVATYGQLGKYAGLSARQVGRAMGQVPSGATIPWFRVINAGGKSSLMPGDGYETQLDHLRAEGIAVSAGGRVNLRHFRWEGPGFVWALEQGFDPDRLDVQS